MLISKLKTIATVLFLVVLAALGAGELTRADKPQDTKQAAAKSEPVNVEGLSTFSAKVVAASKDGKSFTVEMPAQARGEEPKRTDIHTTDKTEITYHGVGLNAATPTEGYHAHVWLKQGSTDTAAKVMFYRLSENPHHIDGKVSAVANDGKTITLELPPGRGEDQPRKIDIKLTDKTRQTYFYAAKDAARPTEGYQAHVWLETRGSDTAAKAEFVDSGREQEFLISGAVAGISKDGNTITLNVPPKLRGEDARKADIKITLQTDFTFHGVGPDQAKLTSGYGARVWLQEQAPDTAAKIMLIKGTGRGR